ncbi:hypothetical protein GCK72_024191 [Caenorhabditis remanei]|nr:hypothetical protein GCK72_024191 [Caenorhabditis remanei]KAF1747725.1 hypothetical protein GCK72_024191 [Caenorhabditis remanei]
MKVQTGVSSKDLSTLKEMAELEKHKESMEASKMNEENSKVEAETEKAEEEHKTDVVDKINVAKAKWETCFLKPDNCCVVKAVRKLTN